MCGIFGWSLKKRVHLSNRKLKQVFDVLSAGNDMRGGNSWGLYVNDDSSVQKGLGEISDARFDPNKILPFKSRQFFAHTRYATQGSVSIQNSHPFTIGNITGCHNGIIYNHSELNREYNRDYAVDSMHLFGHINELQQLSELDGYGTIVFVDSRKPDALMLGRFDGELSVAILPYKDGVIWSSSDTHLNLALRVAHLHGKLYKVKDKVLYRVSNGKIKSTPIKLDINRSQVGSWRTCGWQNSVDDFDFDDKLPAHYAKTKWANDDVPEETDIDALAQEYKLFLKGNR